MASSVIDRARQVKASGLNANRGMGMQGWVPAAGDHQSSLVDIELLEGVKFDWKSNGGGKRPGWGVVFRYRLLSDPDSPEGPRQFAGKRFVFPNEVAGLPEGQQDRVRIEQERLKGHLCTILGVDELDDLGAGLESAIAEVERIKKGESTVDLVVSIRYREYNNEDRFDNEYLKERL